MARQASPTRSGYLGDHATVQTVAARLDADPVPPTNPLLGRAPVDVRGPGRLPVRPRAECWENSAGIAAMPIQPEAVRARARRQATSHPARGA
jgi:hypothetical protein